MKLFTPMSIRGLELSTRTAMAPMVINMAGRDGAVTPSFTDFYLARARSDVGYIVLGASYVHEDGRGFSGQLGVDRDELCGGLENLAAR
ncbi:MAG: hypothetical protein K9K79_09635, partial [Desulfohalobiaceae bacterium]|nr:hypothetical protein [Desulfohalobiaceae bacterium]